jgi:uncharacterized protein YndB with AHSA1/START domain
MPSPVVVRVTRRYKLPVERVFDAWITPALASRFLFATRTGNVLYCEIVPEVGGHFLVTDRRPNADEEESFYDAEHRGTYVEIERPHRLAFDFSVDPLGQHVTRVTIDFVTMGAQITEVVLAHNLGTDEDARVHAERTRQGWTRMLDQLEKVLTTRTWGFRPTA